MATTFFNMSSIVALVAFLFCGWKAAEFYHSLCYLFQRGASSERRSDVVFTRLATDPLAADPYVRVATFHEGGLLKKKKTSTKRQTSNPTYNNVITFIVPPDVLPQVEIQFCVVHESG